MKERIGDVLIALAVGVLLGYFMFQRPASEEIVFPENTIDSLQNEITKLTYEIVAYREITDSLSYQISIADSSAEQLKTRYHEKTSVITTLSTDSLASILSDRYDIFSFSPY
jgi:peptidoglycan hydrolase CwlO-like protein